MIHTSQFHEDEILWYNLYEVEQGRYVDVGANAPFMDSVTGGFYNEGWRGILVEPVAEYAHALRVERPDDLVYECAVANHTGTMPIDVMAGTGLSTMMPGIAVRHGRTLDRREIATRPLSGILVEAGWDPIDPIHFMTIDVEGFEGEVLRSFDLKLWQPWYLVIEAIDPVDHHDTRHRFEDIVLAAGYHYDGFDSVNCYYSAPGHDPLPDHLIRS